MKAIPDRKTKIWSIDMKSTYLNITCNGVPAIVLLWEDVDETKNSQCVFRTSHGFNYVRFNVLPSINNIRYSLFYLGILHYYIRNTHYIATKL